MRIYQKKIQCCCKVGWRHFNLLCMRRNALATNNHNTLTLTIQVWFINYSGNSSKFSLFRLCTNHSQLKYSDADSLHQDGNPRFIFTNFFQSIIEDKKHLSDQKWFSVDDEDWCFILKGQGQGQAWRQGRWWRQSRCFSECFFILMQIQIICVCR